MNTGGGSAKDPLAFCQLTLAEGKNLLNVEAFKKSDPFCTVKVGSTFIGQTGTIENTLDPKWDAPFAFAFHSYVVMINGQDKPWDSYGFV
jgi:Ca2+-dependent lipid-binding protein